MRGIWLHRLIWFLAFAGSAVLIGIYGGAASFLFFWCLALMPVFSAVFHRIVKAGVVIRLEVEDHNVIRGERLPCVLRLTNETYLPIPQVRIQMFDGKIQFPDEEQRIICSLKPLEEKVFRFEPLCRHLGNAKLGASSILIPDWFILSAVKYERTERVHILPRQQRLDSMQILPPREEERRQIERSYFGDKVPDGQWRLYQSGDDLRRVHWKLSARQQQLIMKNLIPEPRNELVLIPDGRSSLPEGRQGWMAEDSIIEGTLAIADYYLRFGIALVIAPDLMRKISVTEISAYQKLYKLMARGYFSGTKRADEVLEAIEGQGGSSRYILLTWELDETFIRRISMAISHGADVTVILIGDAPEAAELAKAERRLSFYQVTSRHDIFQTLKGGSEREGAR